MVLISTILSLISNIIARFLLFEPLLDAVFLFLCHEEPWLYCTVLPYDDYFRLTVFLRAIFFSRQ